jgi:phosphoribosylformylglycinamidine cyclo-ligase
MSEEYKKAGVDIEAGYEAVSRIKSHIGRTKIPGVMGQLGGFGGLFDLSVENYKEPVLVSGTDGVGTKLLLAFQLNKHDTIGVDVVAMCVNDIVTSGAKPLFFLDYIACGKLEPEKIEAIVSGVSDGCVQSGCALVGGETAEMPGMYRDNEYDIAGFSVGAVEKSRIITGKDIVVGDAIIGLASSGIHSNGFSLVRKIIKDNDLSLFETYEGFDERLGDVLLTPTKIYVKSILEVLNEDENTLFPERDLRFDENDEDEWFYSETDSTEVASHGIKGIAHITGGGFYENIPRILPAGLGCRIKRGFWNIPPIFKFLKDKGKLSEKEMYNVFNMGIGMVLVTDSILAPKIVSTLKEYGEEASIIGKVISGDGLELI